MSPLPSILSRFSALLMVLGIVCSVQGQFGGLTSRIPRDANAIVILNTERIKASPLAQKENWRAQHEQAHASGLTILPPTARHFVLAAKMDLDYMQPIWEVVLAELSYTPSMAQIATKWGGAVDRVAGKTAALLPDDSYVLPFGENKVGAMRPANRQSVSRWIRSTDTTNYDNLSNYLAKAQAYADQNGTPIILALDLHDVIAPDAVKAKSEMIKSLQSDIDIDRLANAISGIRGITLGITIKDRIGGALIIDFSDDVTFMKDIAKPLVLQVLSNHSAMIDEFETWRVDVRKKNQIRIGGPLYRSGLRRILSILDVPASLHDSMPSAGEASEEDAAKISSQAYFKSVTGLVEDLQEKPRHTDVKTAGQVGLWYGRYAKKIDNLPMLNVDPGLLDYGAFVAESLREAEAALRDVGGRSRVRQLNAPAQYRTASRWGSWGGYGYGGVGWVESPRLEAQNRARIATEERARGARSAREIMQGVANATADVRRQMTEKYQAEF